MNTYETVNKLVMQEFDSYYTHGIKAIQRKDYDSAKLQIEHIIDGALNYSSNKDFSMFVLNRAKEYHDTLKYCLNEKLN